MAKRRDPEEMRGLLARRRRHGLSWAELETESGVPRSTLCWWHRRLRGSPDRHAAGGFVQVVAVAPAPVGGSLAPIEIVFEGGCRVVVPPGFDLEHLRRVLEAVGSRC